MRDRETTSRETNLGSGPVAQRPGLRARATLITGAGGGIGRALTRTLARRGHRLLATGLSDDELAPVRAETGAETLALDLAEADAPARLFAFAAERGLEVDVLVNCAGLGFFGAHDSLDDARVRTMLAVNVQALTALCAHAARGMRARRRGTILNVASTASFQPLPGLAAYAASKAYVVAFTLGLAEELAPDGVHACVICPGTTRTPFIEAAGIDARSRTGALAHRVAMSPDVVAEHAADALESGARLTTPGVVNRAHRLASRLVSAEVAARVFGAIAPYG